MIKCKKCKFKSEKFNGCSKIKGYDPTAFLDHYSSGTVYVNPKRDNKDGKCEFYERSFFSFLK